MKIKINIKLKSRQIYHFEESNMRNLKYCIKCKSYLVEYFMNPEDPLLCKKLEMMNPLTLESLFLKVLAFMDSGTYDELLHGKKDINEFIEEKHKLFTKTKDFTRSLVLKDFSQAFDNQQKLKMQELKN